MHLYGLLFTRTDRERCLRQIVQKLQKDQKAQALTSWVAERKSATSLDAAATDPVEVLMERAGLGVALAAEGSGGEPDPEALMPLLTVFATCLTPAPASHS